MSEFDFRGFDRAKFKSHALGSLKPYETKNDKVDLYVAETVLPGAELAAWYIENELKHGAVKGKPTKEVQGEVLREFASTMTDRFMERFKDEIRSGKVQATGPNKSLQGRDEVGNAFRNSLLDNRQLQKSISESTSIKDDKGIKHGVSAAVMNSVLGEAIDKALNVAGAANNAQAAPGPKRSGAMRLQP